MSSQQIDVLRHQDLFVADRTTPFLALVGGFGSGKTRALALKAVDLAAIHAPYDGALIAPTYSLALDVLMPEFEYWLDHFGVAYKLHKSPQPKYVIQFPQGSCTVYVRNFERYGKLVGLNLAWAVVDELDIVDAATARSAWFKLLGRLRRGKCPQLATASTPEGFRFLYQFFVKEAKNRDGTPKTDRRIIKARTRDNPFLAPSFIPSLEANYPPALIQAYLNGEFVNLVQGQVYSSFDRKLNHCNATIHSQDRLHIGIDFNVRKMAAVVHVLRVAGQEDLPAHLVGGPQRDRLPRAVGEFVDLADTSDLIEAIQERYQGYRITCYPDASGGSPSTNASQSDLDLLSAAGFEIDAPDANPRVTDRINAMNAMFCNALGDRRYLVNTVECPTYTEALEQQPFDKNGKPDKSQGLDHIVDAGGYFLHRLFPIPGHQDTYDLPPSTQGYQRPRR